MIVCGDCGNENEEGDAFCGVCGSFLEWEGRKVSTAREPVLAAVEEGQPAERGVIGRVVDRFAGGEQGPADGPPGLDAAEPTAVAVVEDHDSDPAATLAAETAERAHLAAEAAERARADAEERARREAESAEAARQEAEEAEQARLRAQEAVAEEAAEAERLRRQLEEAEASRAAAQTALETERENLERLRQESEQAAAEEVERTRQQAEERLAAEREAVQQARAEAEAAEAARHAAEERARAEGEAAAAAAREAAEAEKARQEADAKAAAEAEAADQARRAAALVARPKPKPPEPAPPKKEIAATRAVRPAQPTKQVQAVKPTRTKARPTPKRTQAPSRKIRPGDLICGNCGEGNDPERKFCRRCGQNLQDAEVARTRWWQRLPGRRRRTYAAGERRGRRRRRDSGALAKGRAARRKFARVMGFVTRAGALLALVGVVGLGVGPWRPAVTDWAGERFTAVRQFVAPQFDPIRAADATGSSEREDHPASHAVDTLSNTWWATAGEGLGATLLVTFPEAVDVEVVGVTSGAADVGEFANQPRPAKLHLLFDNGYDVELELADRHEFQPFRLDRDGATGVQNVLVRVTEVYPGQAGEDLSITEIEFQTRR
jgi:hypothetical protein